MRIEYVWAVYGEQNHINDGPITHVFSKKKFAMEFAKNKGYWGGDAKVTKVEACIDEDSNTAHVIENSFVLNDGKTKEDLKAKALAKLSEEEKKVLGLSCGK